MLFLYSTNASGGFLNYFVLGILIFTIFIAEIAIYLFSGGINVFIAHIFYFPIIFSAFLHPRRSAVLSTTIAALYYLVMLALVYPDTRELIPVTIQFFVFVSVGVVVASLSGALKMSEVKYRNIFNNSGNCACIVDTRSGAIIEASRQCRTTLGKTNLSRLLHAPCEDVPGNVIEALALKGRVCDAEIELADGEGNSLQVLVSGGMLPDGLAVVTITDISKRIRAEEQLRESEQRFRELADLLPQAVFEIDEHRVFRFVNRNAFEVFGYSCEEYERVIDAIEVIAPEERERALHNIRYWDLERARAGVEYTALRKDGSTFPAVIYSTPVIRNGNFAGIRGILVDVSPINEAKKALRESEILYRTIFDNSGAATAIVGDDECIVLANTQFDDLLGYSADDLVGMKWTTLLIAEDRVMVEDIYRTRKTNPERIPEHCEMRFRHYDGHILTCLGTVTCIPESDRAVLSFVDTTEMKRYRDALQEANKKLNNLSSITRHDLLNQLTGVVGYMELLAEMVPDDPIIGEYINRIMQCIASLTDQVRFTKDYQDMGVKPPAWHRIDSLIGQAAAMVPGEGCSITTETGDIEIFADPLIFNVFFTLIEIIVRTGSGSCALTVRFFDDEDGGHLTIEGDGGGMPPELRARLIARGSANGDLAVLVAREILGITGMALCLSDTPDAPVWFEIAVPREMFRRGPPGNCDPHHPVHEGMGVQVSAGK